LTSEGIITGFTAKVAPDALGHGVCALLLLSARQGAWHEVRAPRERDAKSRLSPGPDDSIGVESMSHLEAPDGVYDGSFNEWSADADRPVAYGSAA